jgi:DNA-binding transcriptional MocR family regulator
MNKEKSFRARWGEVLAKNGITAISTLFLRIYPRMDITTVEAMFIVHCFSYKWTVDSPYPSFFTVANEMGVGRGTVQRYARSLEEKGFIKRVYRKGNSSEIDVTPLIKILEHLIPCSKLDKESVEICKEAYLKTNNKKEALIKSF